MPILFQNLQQALPRPGVALLVAALALCSALLLGALAGWLRVSRKVAAPYTRKLFHIGIFSLAAGVQVAWGAPAVFVYGGVVAMVVLFAVWRGNGTALYEALARPTDAPHRTLFVVVPLLTTALGGVIVNLLFHRVAWIGYLVAGWGDALGEPAGTRWGRHRFRVPSLAGVRATRSLEGSTAVLLGGATAAAAGLLATGHALPGALITALAAGTAGAIVEAVSTHGLDNLTVQVAAAAAAYLLIGGT